MSVEERMSIKIPVPQTYTGGRPITGAPETGQ